MECKRTRDLVCFKGDKATRRVMPWRVCLTEAPSKHTSPVLKQKRSLMGSTVWVLLHIRENIVLRRGVKKKSLNAQRWPFKSDWRRGRSEVGAVLYSTWFDPLAKWAQWSSNEGGGAWMRERHARYAMPLVVCLWYLWDFLCTVIDSSSVEKKFRILKRPREEPDVLVMFMSKLSTRLV